MAAIMSMKEYTVGSFQYPAVPGNSPSSTLEELDSSVKALQAHEDAWVEFNIEDRVALLDEMIRDYAGVVPRLVEAEAEAKGYADDDYSIGQEWIGQVAVLKNMRSLQRALRDIKAVGRPRIPGRVYTRANGQVVAEVFPETVYDRVLFGQYRLEVWMEQGVTEANLARTQALAYRDKSQLGKVALVLGAGNLSALPSGDLLYKLFVENQVVLLKMNPVNAYAGPILEEGFRALVKRGFLRVVYGGPAEGEYLCRHPGIDEIHLTGSDKTFEAVVFGSGAEGIRRKAERQLLLTKRVTGELGNVTPVIIVPGRWSARDMTYQVEKLVAWLAGTSGFTCNTPHALVTNLEWPQREQFLAMLRQHLAQVPTHKAFYPGAHARQQFFVSAHPEAEQYGGVDDYKLPWTLITEVRADNPHDICFTTESFCGLLAEVPLQAASVSDYLDRAVMFTNDTLWGTLSVGLFVDPKTAKREVAALDRAVVNLRYGIICINSQAGYVWSFAIAPWGSFPGQNVYDVQSGIGSVHNSLMFSQPQKTVLRAPFVDMPKSVALVNRGKAYRKTAQLLADLELSPSPTKLPLIIWTVLRG